MAGRRTVRIARTGAPRNAADGGVEWPRHAVHAMTPKEIRSRRLALALTVDELAQELRLAPGVVRALENGDDPPLPDAGVLQRVFDRLEAVAKRRD
jgi:DNA-binding transcriptional regulator YiaG